MKWGRNAARVLGGGAGVACAIAVSVSSAAPAAATSGGGWQPAQLIAGQTYGSANPLQSQSNSTTEWAQEPEGPAVSIDPLGPVTVLSTACSPFQGYSGPSCEPTYAPLLSQTLSGGSWSQSQLPNGSGSASYQVATGANGDTVAVYTGCRPQDVFSVGGSSGCDTRYGNTSQWGIFVTQRVSGTTDWTAPELVASEPDPNTAAYTSPELTVDQNGNAWIAWVDPTAGMLMAVHMNADGTLGSPAQISPSTGFGVDRYQLTGDAAGDAAVTFEQGDNSTGGGTGAVVESSHVSSGSWTAATTIDSNAEFGYYQFLLAGLGAGGQPVAGWVSSSPTSTSEGIYSTARKADGSWTTPAALPDTGGSTMLTSQLMRDDAGDLKLAWSETDGSGNYNYYVGSLPAGGSWSDQQVASVASGNASAQGPISLAVNGAGDAVASWEVTPPSSGTHGTGQAWAAVAPAGHQFGSPTEIDDCASSGCTAATGLTAVIDEAGNATVVFDGVDNQADAILMAAHYLVPPGGTTTTTTSTTPSTTTTSSTTTTNGGATTTTNGGGTTPTQTTPGSGAGSTTTTETTPGSGGGSGSGPSGSGGVSLPPVTSSPGAPQPGNCASSAKMPSYIGSVWDESVTKLENTRLLTVIERRPAKPPHGITAVGQVYAQVPKPGAEIDPCTTHVRIVLYGGPSGLTVHDFKLVRTMTGEPLDTVDFGHWKIESYRFTPANVKVPTITKVDFVGGDRHAALRLDVAMPQNTTDPWYDGWIGHTAPFTGKTDYISPDAPPPGADGALSAGLHNLFGVYVGKGGAPANAQVIVDTHDVGNALDSSDNLIADQKITTLSGAAVLSDGTHFNVSPLHDGHIYVVACEPNLPPPCIPIAIDSIPVITRHDSFPSDNGFTYSADGKREAQITGYPGDSAHPASARAADASAIGTLASRFFFWITHLSGGNGETTVSAGAKPAPVALTSVAGKSVADVKPAKPTDSSAPSTQPAYDFGTGLLPILDSGASGLPPGIYKVVGSQAVNTLDSSSHIIGAGSANLQQGEVFGVVSVGNQAIVGAGANNLIQGAAYLNGGAFHLDPGTYEVSRDEEGTITATPIIAAGAGNYKPAGAPTIIGAGSGNIVGAGANNIIGAGANNLANGYYNVISAGSNNLQSPSGYGSLLGAIPQAWVPQGLTTTLLSNGTLATNAASQVAGFLGSGQAVDIPSFADPGRYVTPAGQIISDSGGSIVSNNNAGIVSNNNAGIVSNNNAGIVSNNNAGFTHTAESHIVSNNNAGIIAAGAGNIIGAGSNN